MAINEVFSQTGEAIVSPIVRIFDSIVGQIPYLIGAIVVLIVGYFVGLALGHVVKVILLRLGFDRWIEREQITKKRVHASLMVGEFVKWFTFVVFLTQSVALVKFEAIANLLTRFSLWLPNLLVAAAILIAGIGISHFVESKIDRATELSSVRFTAKVLKVVLMIIFVVAAFRLILPQVTLLENLILIIVGALGVGLALALGIGFGLGFKKEAEKLLNEVKKRV